MLHSDMKIQYMDVKGQQVFTETIARMFQRYSLKATVDTGMHTIIFDSDITPVKITDMTGWTDVKAIRKIKNTSSWNIIGSMKSANQILSSDDNLIPVYDDQSPFQGFHGETKYPYVSKLPCDICDGDKIRIHRGIDTAGNDIEFTPISFSGSKFPISEDEIDWGYEIETKSGFFNANNVHLLSAEIIPIIK